MVPPDTGSNPVHPIKLIEMSSDIDIEIKNNKALSFLWHEIKQLKEQVHGLIALKECGQCGIKVPLNEWHSVYKDSGKGVCEGCWQRDYVPYMKDPAK